MMKQIHGQSVFRSTQLLLFFAFGALLLGLVFYLLFRPEESAPLLRLLPRVSNVPHANALAFSLNWLPSFIHVFSFSLMTWFTLGRRYALLSASIWCAINLFFEFVQYNPEYLKMLSTYYGGTFDTADVFACLSGAAAAWAVTKITQLRGKEDEVKT